MTDFAPYRLLLDNITTPLVTCEPHTITWNYFSPPPEFDIDTLYLKFTLMPQSENGEQVSPDGALSEIRVPVSNRHYDWESVSIPPGTWFLSTRTYMSEPGVGPGDTYTRTGLFEVEEGEDTSCVGQPGPSGNIASATLDESASLPSTTPDSEETSSDPGDNTQSSSTAPPDFPTNPPGDQTEEPNPDPTDNEPEDDDDSGSQEGAATRTGGSIKHAFLGGAAVLLLRLVVS